MSRCKPGDLAIVISAANKSNIGCIVKIIELHHGKGPLAMAEDCAVWMIEGPTPMIWTDGPSKIYRMNRGPVPDSQLQPIRALPTHKKSSRRKLQVAI